MTARVALVGVNGHGRWHVDNIARLASIGTATLVAACDAAPIGDMTRSLLAANGAAIFTSYDEMLDLARPDVVVLVTPPATHLPMATTAMAAGADVLVEKPATVRRKDLDALIETAASLDRQCQIGFQSCGSYAFDRIAGYTADGTFGTVRRVFAAGAWSRPRAYFQRSPWAGRRFVDGTAVGDGAVANPFAHALMNCLELAAAVDVGADQLEAELFHANPIDSDDTSSVRLQHGEVSVNLAVTLCADLVVEPYVVVVGDRASARWQYTTDELWLDRNGQARRIELPPTRDLLADLIESRAAGRPPICPPERCRGFTTVTERLLDGPVPRDVGGQHIVGDDPVAIRGVSAMVEYAAAAGRLFSEAGAPWA